MNKKIKKLISSLCLTTMCLGLTLSYNSDYTKVLAESLTPENGVGVISFEEQKEIAEGVFLNAFNSISPTTKEQKGHTITFNPKEADVDVLMTYGNTLYSRKTLSSMIKTANDKGYTVIGGINGDFFQMDSGVPVGLTVQNGKLISANGKGWNAEGTKKEHWNAFGLKKDGSVVIGNPDISLEYTVNNNTKPQNILQFNKKRNELGVFLYTSDYSSNTQTNMNSLDIVLEIKEGEVKLGQTIKCKVEKITEEVTYTPIEEGKLLLSAEVYTPGFWQLKELKLGDEVNILMSDKSGQWNDVVQAIGGYKSLLKNGEVQALLDTTDRYPTTAMGVKKNGEVVFLQVDGRQPGWSNGIPHRDTANYLKSIGCTDALLLDGGGSSTMAAKLPIEESARIINKPSDGRERAVGNGLILLAKSKRNNELAKLYAYPNKIRVVEGSSFSLKINGTDASYYPVPLPSNLKYEVSPNLGSISSTGVFTAGNIKGIGNIKISYGSVSTNIEVEIINYATVMVEKALLTKTFYDYNMAVYEVNKLSDGVDKSMLLSKLLTIGNIVWSDEIKSVNSKLTELASTGSAKIYNEIQIQINNSSIAEVDKAYLLGELTAWGKDLVWTDDFKIAMQYFMEFYNSKNLNSAKKAETYILKIKNKYSRDYLLEELANLKKAFNI